MAAEIRERFLSFFEERGHLCVPSASLVPSSYDPSVLLTTAGMQPFKPYFSGEEEPPSRRLTSCQKSFRTTDIENVGLTHRHLTFFEMLGNFSIGDYFKEGAVEYALELVTQGFGFAEEDLWITVFGGDEELGLGPDNEAIACWRAIGIPDGRIVLLGREDNFWQSGPTGPCGPCSELYLDRGPAFGADTDRPGDDTERFLEFWNLVFMQYELQADGSLPELPSQNIDTGMGLERMAAILQDVESVYETDLFVPLVRFGEELSGRSYGQDDVTTRALRILADHGRAAAFLLADGVVPSNEERGYILRRIMRRTMQQGHALGVEQRFLPQLYETAVEVMGDAYPELKEQWPTIERWARAEEESFGRTLEQGERLLGELVERAKAENTSWVSAEDAFRLHDTYGFPYEMTKELLAEEGLSVDDQGFEELMERAREVSRAGASTRTRARAEAGGGSPVHLEHEEVLRFAKEANFRTRFVGYETTEAESVLRAAEGANGWMLAKLEESPFYPEGGGQVSDRGSSRRRRAARASSTCTGWATTRLWRSSRSRASSASARASTRWSSGARGSRRCAITPPPTCSTPPCASGSARTCARRVPMSGRTSCASTSPTASASAPRSCATSRAGSGPGSPATTTCARSRRRGMRPRRSARWRCSARSTATGSGWSRSRTYHASSAAARTWRGRPRSGSFT